MSIFGIWLASRCRRTPDLDASLVQPTAARNSLEPRPATACGPSPGDRPKSPVTGVELPDEDRQIGFDQEVAGSCPSHHGHKVAAQHYERQTQSQKSIRSDVHRATFSKCRI